MRPVNLQDASNISNISCYEQEANILIERQVYICSEKLSYTKSIIKK